MRDVVISLSFGAAVLLAGGIMLRFHFRTWSQHKQDPHLDDIDRRHYHRQFRRRVQTSGLVVLLGLLIPAGDLLIARQPNRRDFALYLMAVLVLLLWVVMLAILDWISGYLYTKKHRSDLNNLLKHQEELQKEVDRLRQQRGNGHHHE